ncbi:Putative lipid carrier protein [Pseudomonas sp. CMR5c]|nr:Putative lipid carrier protein [Pseudomonas sp. CMR5c]
MLKPTQWLLKGVAKNVGEAASARQKPPKKRSSLEVNEHFEPAFNAAMATQVVFRGALKSADRILPLVRRVPFGLQRLALEQALNRCLAEPLADGEFDLLRGRWLCLRISDLDLTWYLTRQRDGLHIARRARADVSIRGNWREFLLLASRQEDPDTLFFRRRLVIEGDTELGLTLKNLIDSLDPQVLPGWLWRNLERAGQGLAGTSGPGAQPG